MFNYAALSLHPNLERISELCCTTLVLFISAQWRLRNRGTYLTKHPPQHTNGNTLPPVADGLHCSDSNTAAIQLFLFFFFFCAVRTKLFFSNIFFCYLYIRDTKYKMLEVCNNSKWQKLDLQNIYFKCNYKSLHRYLKVSVSGFTIRHNSVIYCYWVNEMSKSVFFFQINEK